MPDAFRIGAVIIGRNEGERLKRCLASLKGVDGPVVYVDSGSTDGSVEFAESVGVNVVALDLSKPFTAARARNEGLSRLSELSNVDFVQFVDGDCALQPGWLEAARDWLGKDDDIAIVCGRRREQFPDATIYNLICDAEWDTPIGEAKACGGDILARRTALENVGGYNPLLIAGEEPEMCIRLREKGWKIWRIDVEMTLHDAALTRFSQFWQRTRRCGYTWAEGVVMHGGPPERHGVAGLRRSLVWGAAIPLFAIITTIAFGGIGLVLLLLYPLQIARLAVQLKSQPRPWPRALLLTVGKFAEARGVLDYVWRRLISGKTKIIEYK